MKYIFIENYFKGGNVVWYVFCFVVFFSVIENELSVLDVKILFFNGCKCVVEGVNMSLSNEVIELFL